MDNDILKLNPHEIVSIERESEPGVYYRCIVMPGRRELMIQDRYGTKPKVWNLKAFMKEHKYTQQMLAEVLGVSRATVNRYLNDEREIPAKCFELLGMSGKHSELQKQAHIDKLYSIAAKAHALCKQIDRLVELDT